MRVHERPWILCRAAHGEVRGPVYEEDLGLVHRLVHGAGHGQLHDVSEQVHGPAHGPYWAGTWGAHLGPWVGPWRSMDRFIQSAGSVTGCFFRRKLIPSRTTSATCSYANIAMLPHPPSAASPTRKLGAIPLLQALRLLLVNSLLPRSLCTPATITLKFREFCRKH